MLSDFILDVRPFAVIEDILSFQIGVEGRIRTEALSAEQVENKVVGTASTSGSGEINIGRVGAWLTGVATEEGGRLGTGASIGLVVRYFSLEVLDGYHVVVHEGGVHRHALVQFGVEFKVVLAVLTQIALKVEVAGQDTN